MNSEVDLAFDGPDGHPGIDHVALVRAMGADGTRVTDPHDIQAALAWAVRESERRRIPVLIEILTDREESAAMGAAIDSIVEPHELRTIRKAPAGRGPAHAGLTRSPL